jgi:hypothetical protein
MWPSLHICLIEEIDLKLLWVRQWEKGSQGDTVQHHPSEDCKNPAIRCPFGTHRNGPLFVLYAPTTCTSVPAKLIVAEHAVPGQITNVPLLYLNGPRQRESSEFTAHTWGFQSPGLRRQPPMALNIESRGSLRRCSGRRMAYGTRDSEGDKVARQR